MATNLDDFIQKILNRSDDITALFSEAEQLPTNISDCIKALSLYSRSLTEDGKYYHEGSRYVLYPNFVAFTPRYKRASHVTIELRGNPKEFDQKQILPLTDARAGSYSKCNFKSQKQLAAACAYIERAWSLYKKGGGRVRLKPVTKEVPIEP